MNSFHILKIESFPSDQLIELLEENTIGTPGKSMVYEHVNVREKVSMVSNPYFASLSIRNRLYGTICFSKREVFISGKPYQAFYLRYFTFRESFRTTNPRDHKRKTPSIIREDLAQLMNGKGLDFDRDLLMYAYVDPRNTRSVRMMAEFGFEKISSFQVVSFSRIWPKKSKHVEAAKESRYAEIKEYLIELCKDEQLVSFENLFRRGDYFIFMDRGKMVCGVQAIPDQWKILEMPGVGGKILMNIIPEIPILNRLFHPEYKFVFFESAFCLDGYEKQLSLLFESTLVHYNVNSGILCLDQKSAMYSMVKKNNLGFTHKIQGEKQIDIVVKTSDKNLINGNLPISVSGIDVL